MNDREGPDDVFKNPHHFFLRRRQDAEGGDVGADSHEPGMAQREHAREAVDEIQGQRENGVDRDEIEDLHLVAVQMRFGPLQEERENGDGHHVEDRVADGRLHILSSARSPKSPVGLTRSTSTSTTKAKASRYPERLGMKATVMISMKPSSRPPIIAP